MRTLAWRVSPGTRARRRSAHARLSAGCAEEACRAGCPWPRLGLVQVEADGPPPSPARRAGFGLAVTSNQVASGPLRHDTKPVTCMLRWHLVLVALLSQLLAATYSVIFIAPQSHRLNNLLASNHATPPPVAIAQSVGIGRTSVGGAGKIKQIYVWQNCCYEVLVWPGNLVHLCSVPTQRPARLARHHLGPYVWMCSLLSLVYRLAASASLSQFPGPAQNTAGMLWPMWRCSPSRSRRGCR